MDDAKQGVHQDRCIMHFRLEQTYVTAVSVPKLPGYAWLKNISRLGVGAYQPEGWQQGSADTAAQNTCEP